MMQTLMLKSNISIEPQDKKKDNWMWAHRWLNLSGGPLEAGDTLWSGAVWRIRSEMTLMLWRFCPFSPFSPLALERKWESAAANSNSAHCLGAGHTVHGKIPWRASKKKIFFLSWVDHSLRQVWTPGCNNCHTNSEFFATQVRTTRSNLQPSPQWLQPEWIKFFSDLLHRDLESGLRFHHMGRSAVLDPFIEYHRRTPEGPTGADPLVWKWWDLTLWCWQLSSHSGHCRGALEQTHIGPCNDMLTTCSWKDPVQRTTDCLCTLSWLKRSFPWFLFGFLWLQFAVFYTFSLIYTCINDQIVQF